MLETNDRHVVFGMRAIEEVALYERWYELALHVVQIEFDDGEAGR